VLCSELFAECAYRRSSHDPISILAPAGVTLILQLNKIEVIHFKEETVEHNDADLSLDELSEEI
jgi:hypothetical protein